jgi:hypothetical protein
LVLGKRTSNPDIVKEKIIKCNPIADDSLALELKEFISAIEDKREGNGVEAYDTLKIVEEVYKQNKI